MKITRKLLAKLSFCVAIISSAAVYASAIAAHDIYIIANGDLPIPRYEIKDVFLGQKQLVNGIKLVPIDNAASQKDFLKNIIKMDAARYNVNWTKRSFREGLNPPETKSSDAEVIATVRAKVGAIGYVSSAPPGVTVLYKFVDGEY